MLTVLVFAPGVIVLTVLVFAPGVIILIMFVFAPGCNHVNCVISYMLYSL